MKNLLKILGIIFLTLIIINVGEIYTIKVFATGMGDVTENPDYWRPWGEGTPVQLNKKAGVVTGIIKIIGVLVSVISLSIIGIKFMLGSVEEKAQYKQTLIPWIVGACMVFAMTLIPDFVYDLMMERSTGTPMQGEQHSSGQKAGYVEGMDFMRGWYTRGKDDAEWQGKYNEWQSVMPGNAEETGRQQGRLQALRNGKNKDFYDGYFAADTWVVGKSQEEINEVANDLYNRVKIGMGKSDSFMYGYGQRLSLE